MFIKQNSNKNSKTKMSTTENRSSFNQFHKNSCAALEVAELNNEQFSGATVYFHANSNEVLVTIK